MFQKINIEQTLKHFGGKTLSLAHSAAVFSTGNMPHRKYTTDKIGTHAAIAGVCYLTSNAVVFQHFQPSVYLQQQKITLFSTFVKILWS